jgi:hypothetical protein
MKYIYVDMKTDVFGKIESTFHVDWTGEVNYDCPVYPHDFDGVLDW